MRFDFTIYPEAQQRLDTSGLTERIKKAHRDYKISLTGHMLENEIVDCIKDMNKSGLLNPLSAEEKQKIQNAWKNRAEGAWVVNRFDGAYREEVDVADFLLFTGWKASEILGKKDLFDFKKFGFTSPTEFAGTVSAAIERELHGDTFRAGYQWGAKHPNGQIFVNQITGDMNSDLRVFQTDITPYETTDPLGNKVHYRPNTSPDRGVIGAYHTNEASMLIAVLKWIEQSKMSPESLQFGASKTIAWTKSLGQGGGTCTEHFGGFDQDPMQFFIGWDSGLPLLKKDGTTEGYSQDRLSTQSDGSYGAYIGEKGELLFRYESRGDAKSKGQVSASFLQSDADHLVRGLLFQCAKGLGRTSAKQLVDLLEFRYSNDFTANLKRYDIGFEVGASSQIQK